MDRKGNVYNAHSLAQGHFVHMGNNVGSEAIGDIVVVEDSSLRTENRRALILFVNQDLRLPACLSFIVINLIVDALNHVVGILLCVAERLLMFKMMFSLFFSYFRTFLLLLNRRFCPSPIFLGNISFNESLHYQI